MLSTWSAGEFIGCKHYDSLKRRHPGTEVQSSLPAKTTYLKVKFCLETEVPWLVKDSPVSDFAVGVPVSKLQILRGFKC